MKKTLFAIMAVCLLMLSATSSMAMEEGLKGKMKAGGYLGYTIGMGDPFDDQTFDYGGYTATWSMKGGICFGGHFYYGVSPKLMVGGEIGFQSYGSDYSTSGTIPAFGYTSYDPGSSTETNILGSILYQMSENEKSSFFLTGGLGNYGFWDDIGIFGGVSWEKVMSPKMNLFVMPRFHLVMSDPGVNLIQVVVGLNFGLGDK